MGVLRGSSPFFVPGPPAPPGAPNQEVLAFLSPRVEGAILDLGGGLGAYSRALRERGHDVTLAEKDVRCLEAAQSAGLPVLDMNALDLAGLRNRFDTVLLVEVLEHVEDPRAFLAAALACARRKLLLTVPCTDDFAALFASGLTYNHVAVSDHLHHFTSGDIAAMLEELKCRYVLGKEAHLFPGVLLDLMMRCLGDGRLARLSLLPFRLANRLGMVPRALPSRLAVEAVPPWA